MQKSVTVRESESTLLPVTQAQARLLNDLGRQLASKSRYWGSSDEDESSERSVLRCSSDGEVWRLTVHNAVGMIRVDDLQIVVLPKIPLQHFVYLLSIGGELPRFVRDELFALPSPNMLELIAHWFLHELERVLKRDLVRDYTEIIGTVSSIRGQVDALASGSAFYSGSLAFTCIFDEFQLDTPLNRILKAGIVNVAGNSAFSERLRRSASQVVHGLEAVGELRHGDFRATTDRRTAHYRDALLLARLLIERESRAIELGGSRAWSFLIPTPAAIERGIREVLRAGLSPLCKVTNRSRSLAPSDLSVNPDLVFEPDLAVGDVKYKINTAEWSRADLYQVVSFATAYGVTRAALIAFSQDGSSAASVSFGNVTVNRICWDATFSVHPEDAARNLVTSMRDCLERSRAETLRGSISAA